MTEEQVRVTIDIAPDYSTPLPLVVDDLGGFLGLKIPPRKFVLKPIVPEQGLVMLYAMRGVGKTHVALNLAYAIASGGPCLKWTAPEPRRVLYVDGEMPAPAMQERLAAIVAGAKNEPEPGFLRLITPDRQKEPMPCLSSPDGQKMVEACLDAEKTKVLILDNLSTLCRAGKENEADSWGPVQEWLLGLRRRGMSVVLVHHAGKGGNQRGTSKREDVLDTVIALRRPNDYSASEGARFEVHLEKCRGISGTDADPFEARLEITKDGKSDWTTKDLSNLIENQVSEMQGMGMSVRDIAADLGISRSRAHRLTQKADSKTGMNGAGHG